MSEIQNGFTVDRMNTGPHEQFFCEVCQRPVEDVHNLKEYKQIQVEGHTRWSYEEGRIGHKSCLLDARTPHSVMLVWQSEWDKIPDDYKGVWTDERTPEYVGKKTVLSGCLSDTIGALLIEDYHFVILNY